MIYSILFAIVGVGLIAMGLSLFKLSDRVDSWVDAVSRLTELISDTNNRQIDNNYNLAKALKHIQTLEERLEAHADELTEHHNKIDTLEINGTVYESLFEQQGLWGESKEEKHE